MLLEKFLGFTNILIALGAGATVLLTGISLGLDLELLDPSYLITALTGLGYTVQRLIKTRFFPQTARPIVVDFYKKFGLGLVLCWGAILLASVNLVAIGGFGGVMGLEFTPQAHCMGVVLIILGASYAIVPLREKPYLKLPLISIVWALATVVYPVILVDSISMVSIGVLCAAFIARLIYIAGITVPFDVRDLQIDDLKMKTMPQVIGKEQALRRAMWLVGGGGAIWCGLALSGVVNPIVGHGLALHAFITIPLVSPQIVNKFKRANHLTLILDGMLSMQFVILLIWYITV